MIHEKGFGYARFWFWSQAWGCLIQYLFTCIQGGIVLLTSYYKIAWRTLWKSKTYSAINSAGLAVGFAAFILMGLYIHYELSYDRFHPQGRSTLPGGPGG